jgi:hypothetical protein
MFHVKHFFGRSFQYSQAPSFEWSFPSVPRARYYSNRRGGVRDAKNLDRHFPCGAELFESFLHRLWAIKNRLYRSPCGFFMVNILILFSIRGYTDDLGAGVFGQAPFGE